MNKKTPFAQFMDYLTLSIVIGLITYSIYSIFIHHFASLLCLTIFTTIVIFMSLKREISKHNKKINLSREQEKQKTKAIEALKYGDPEKVRGFFVHALSKNYKVSDFKDYLIIEKNNQSAIFIYDFTAQEISLSQLTSKLNLIKDYSIPLYFSAQKFSSDAIIFANTSGFIFLLDENSTFLLFQKFKIYPSVKTEIKPQNSFKIRFLSHLNRGNFFKLLRYSILLFLISNIIPFSTYYRLGGITLLILSIISFFKPIKKSSLHIIPLETN